MEPRPTSSWYQSSVGLWKFYMQPRHTAVYISLMVCRSSTCRPVLSLVDISLVPDCRSSTCSPDTAAVYISLVSDCRSSTCSPEAPAFFYITLLVQFLHAVQTLKSC